MVNMYYNGERVGYLSHPSQGGAVMNPGRSITRGISGLGIHTHACPENHCHLTSQMQIVCEWRFWVGSSLRRYVYSLLRRGLPRLLSDLRRCHSDCPLSLTADHVQIQLKSCEKFASDLMVRRRLLRGYFGFLWESCQWLGVRRWFSPGYSGFLHYFTTG